jgi:hypothetical protein
MNETDILYSIADAEVTSDRRIYDTWKVHGTDKFFTYCISSMVEVIRVRDKLHAASTSEVTKRIINDWQEKE